MAESDKPKALRESACIVRRYSRVHKELMPIPEAKEEARAIFERFPESAYIMRARPYKGKIYYKYYAGKQTAITQLALDIHNADKSEIAVDMGEGYVGVSAMMHPMPATRDYYAAFEYLPLPEPIPDILDTEYSRDGQDALKAAWAKIAKAGKKTGPEPAKS